MTPEEAVERVLQGAWDPCLKCRTTGWITTFDPNGRESKLEKCVICKSLGFVIFPRTREAFELVGAEIPPKPLTQREMRLEELSAGGERIRNTMNEANTLMRILPPARKP